MPLRIGLIGAGANTASQHIPGFRRNEGVEVVGVANRSRESSRRIADQFGISTVFDSPEALCASPEVDAVCIGTWPYKHREFTIMALESGKHVLCEARMAMDLAEAEDMLAASERHPGLVAQLVPAPFDFRLGPTVTRLIAEGALGDVLEVSVTVLNGSGIDPSVPLHWRQRADYSGKNVMMFGIFVEVSLGVEGLLRVSSLTDDYYHYDEKQFQLVGERQRRVFRLADRLRVRVERVDVEHGEIELSLEEAAQQQPKQQPKQQQPKQQQPKQQQPQQQQQPGNRQGRRSRRGGGRQKEAQAESVPAESVAASGEAEPAAAATAGGAEGEAGGAGEGEGEAPHVDRKPRRNYNRRRRSGRRGKGGKDGSKEAPKEPAGETP